MHDLGLIYLILDILVIWICQTQIHELVLVMKALYPELLKKFGIIQHCKQNA